MSLNNWSSGDIISARGQIQKILPDDVEGSRHQRIIIKMPSGETLLVAHNIDMAPRVPHLITGNPISIKGEYEWNDRGGVVHWTHQDPDGSHEAGWIQYQGKKYE